MLKVGGRRRGIRTPIQAPKASVLPLHYVLYISGLKTTHRSSGIAPKFIVYANQHGRQLLLAGTKAGTRTQIVRLSVANTNQLYYLAIKRV